MSARPLVFHFVERGDTSGFFPQLARWHDADQFEMVLGSLFEMDPHLRDEVEGMGVATWSAGARNRADYPRAALRLRRRLAEGVDIFHAHLFEPSLVGLTAARTRRLRTVSTRHHSNYHQRLRKPLHVRLDRLITRLSDEVIAVSEHTARVLIDDEGADPAHVHVVPNGIDVDRIVVSDEPTLSHLRADLAGGDDLVRLVLHPARFHPEKGHFELFEAMAEVQREAEFGVRLLLAGEGAFRHEYEARVADLGLRDVVTFLGFRNDIHDLMAVADLVVLPSLAEAFGLALLEAAWVGTPTVATDVGGLPEIVRSLGVGRLVEPQRPRRLADAILSELVDPYAADADVVRARIRDEYSFERLMRGYEEVYRS